MVRSRFQDFSAPADGGGSGERLAALRRRMGELGLSAFILPRSDMWGNEYLRPCDERLAWVSGFTGSAGLLVVLKDGAALFVDGRYTLQAGRQVDGEVIEVLPVAEHEPREWLAGRLKEGEVAGFDAWLMSASRAERWEKALARRGARLKLLDDNPVDDLWRDRPPCGGGEVFVHGEEYAGRSVADKLALVRAEMGERGARRALVTLTDSVSWLFNLRGRAIAHTPVVLAFALVADDGPASLFMDGAEEATALREALAGVAGLHPLADFPTALAGLGGVPVMVDEAHAAARIVMALKQAGAEIIAADDPCLLPKARKNAAERRGARAAHLRDGAAMARFLCWLEKEAASGTVDEAGAAMKLEECRVEMGERTGEPLFDLSFDTISAAGEHGAIVHYRVTEESNRPLRRGELYLVDSGGQYRDGTTDITRTVFIGGADERPGDEQKRHFTLVLKGLISLSRARFPQGTNGAGLDGLARQFLWREGLDYDHGTGHGVGSFLSVHEGPQNISRRGTVAFEAGMITSVEPGYYRPGHYGIRLENLVLCRPPVKRRGEERAMMHFETLTLCPVERRLIEVALLDVDERAWLDGYHRRVRNSLAPLLEDDGETLAWLDKACAPLAG